MMYRFFVSVHARPAGAAAGDAIELDGQRVSTLRVAAEALSTATFACTFEAARAQLDQLPRLYSEPDGSFVWTSAQGEPVWQIDGNLYDRNERLLFVDLKGTCPAGAFDQFLRAVGWPETQVMFQLTREAVFLDEAAFRLWASAHSTGARPME